MTYIATVTSKGQITIPIEIRKLLNLSFSKRVAFVKKNEEIVIKPVVSLYSLKGSVKSKKKYSDGKVDKKVGKFVAQQYGKKNKAN